MSLVFQNIIPHFFELYSFVLFSFILYHSVQFSLSVMSDSFVIPWTAACQASLSVTNSLNLLKLTYFESVMSSNHPILCRPFLFLPSIVQSIRVFPKESILPIKWPKYWSFSISPSNEYSRLLSFMTDWFDLKSLLQHHSSKASILWC